MASLPEANTLGLASKTINCVGWVVACFPVGVRSETQQTTENVGFRSSTQPTILVHEYQKLVNGAKRLIHEY